MSFYFHLLIYFFYLQFRCTSMGALMAKLCAFTVSFLIVHFFFPFFSSANTIFQSIFLSFFEFLIFFFTCVSALHVFWPNSHHSITKCVVKVYCLTLVLLCFFGMAIKSCKISSFLATSFSVKNSYFFKCVF